MRWKSIALLALGIVPIAVVGLYFANPAGVPSWDPRGRLVGVIPYNVPADSMAPTFPNGTLVTACTWAYVGSTPRRGDVIVFVSPHDGRTPFLKRIVGLEGEAIRWTDDTLHVDDVALDEAYLAPVIAPAEDFEATVPAGHVFVAGDNRSRSLDSRHFGPVRISAIIGKICGKL